MNRKKLVIDIWIGIVMTMLGGLYYLATENFAATVNPDIEGRFMPYVISALMVAAGIALTIVTALKLRLVPKISQKADPAASSDSKKRFIRALIYWLMITLYFFCVTTIGYVVSSVVLLVAAMLYCGYTKTKVIIPVAVIMPLLVWVVFAKLAAIPMPQTILF